LIVTGKKIEVARHFRNGQEPMWVLAMMTITILTFQQNRPLRKELILFLGRPHIRYAQNAHNFDLEIINSYEKLNAVECITDTTWNNGAAVIMVYPPLG
jgi:hypothetical protein